MEWGEGMLGGRDYTGYYRRCVENYRWDSAAMDADTGERLPPDSVSVLGPAQVLHDKQAVPLRISGGEWGSGERVQVSEK